MTRRSVVNVDTELHEKVKKVAKTKGYHIAELYDIIINKYIDQVEYTPEPKDTTATSIYIESAEKVKEKGMVRPTLKQVIDLFLEDEDTLPKKKVHQGESKVVLAIDSYVHEGVKFFCQQTGLMNWEAYNELANYYLTLDIEHVELPRKITREDCKHINIYLEYREALNIKAGEKDMPRLQFNSEAIYSVLKYLEVY